jgi:3-hydroxyacyl-CoA dehydrogenase
VVELGLLGSGIVACLLGHRVRVVIESTTEDLAAKRAILDEWEKTVRFDVVIASNTSSLSITLIQAGRRLP